MCAQLWVHQRKDSNIYCAQIPFKQKQERFLDLHSDTNHMIEFHLLAQHIKQGLQERNSNSNPTLNQIIYMLHSKNHFKNNNFIGIRYASPWNIGTINLANNTKEKFYFFQKVQYCIFEFAKDEICNFAKYSLTDQDNDLFLKLGIES